MRMKIDEDITLDDIVYTIRYGGRGATANTESINHLNEEIYTNQA